MAAAKAAGANESMWLSHVDRAVQVAEQSFKEALRTQELPETWAVANPRPRHETRGGALGDIPQRAVPYLTGLTLAAAKDKVIRVAIGIELAENAPPPKVEAEHHDSSADESEEEENVDIPDKPVVNSPRLGKAKGKGTSKPLVNSSGSGAGTSK
jgi:hypothetical protein